MFTPFDHACLRRALELARQGEGRVEPNPPVGCVIAAEGKIIAEGWHEYFGGPHAEIVALRSLPEGQTARGATIYVTLEPCCHHGKTPPCTEAIIAAAPARVVVAMQDPFPRVAGGGIAQLSAAGIAVEVGLLAAEARELLAPYLMLVEQQRPWTIAKWAMTLDGKLATASGDSKWISSEASRAIVHKLRGRMDAIVVGRGTALADDPLLTARPPGPRTPLRVVLDATAQLPLTSQLVRTAGDTPVLIATGPQAPEENRTALAAAGVEVWRDSDSDPFARLANLWKEFGCRRLTNVLVEGGATLLGALRDAQLIDEAHVFIAPLLSGGKDAPSPLGGVGVTKIADALRLTAPVVETIDHDIYIHGRLSCAPRGKIA